MKSSVAALFSLGRFVHECDFDRVGAATEVPMLSGCGKRKGIRVRAHPARDGARSCVFGPVVNIAARAMCAAKIPMMAATSFRSICHRPR
jgi:hypothetical protein